MVARPRTTSDLNDRDAIGEVGFSWELFLFVWMPCIVFFVLNLLLRRRYMNSLRWHKMLLRMTKDGIDDNERQAIRNLLSNVAILSAFGASITITFVSDTSTFAGAWDTYAAQIYFFMSIASFGTFAVVTVNVTLALLYFDQFTPEQTQALLLEQSLTLFVDPVLAFVSAMVYLTIVVLLFGMRLYGEHAGLGMLIIFVVAWFKIHQIWTTLERFDRATDALAASTAAGTVGKDRSIEAHGKGVAGPAAGSWAGSNGEHEGIGSQLGWGASAASFRASAVGVRSEELLSSATLRSDQSDPTINA